MKEELDYKNKELKQTEQQLNDKDYAINVWRERCNNAEKKVERLEQQVAELQRQLNTLQTTQSPQINNTAPIKKEYSNNSESIVRVGSMDNVGNINDFETTDAETLISRIMDKYKLQTNN